MNNKINSEAPPIAKIKPTENFQIKSMRRRKVNKMVEQQLQQDADNPFLRVPVHVQN